MSLFTVFDNPIFEDNKRLLEFIRKGIVEFEEAEEDCTCDVDFDNGCWYRLSDKEQMSMRIDAIFYRLTQEVADGFPNLIPPES